MSIRWRVIKRASGSSSHSKPLFSRDYTDKEEAVEAYEDLVDSLDTAGDRVALYRLSGSKGDYYQDPYRSTIYTSKGDSIRLTSTAPITVEAAEEKRLRQQELRRSQLGVNKIRKLDRQGKVSEYLDTIHSKSLTLIPRPSLRLTSRGDLITHTPRLLKSFLVEHKIEPSYRSGRALADHLQQALITKRVNYLVPKLKATLTPTEFIKLKLGYGLGLEDSGNTFTATREVARQLYRKEFDPVPGDPNENIITYQLTKCVSRGTLGGI